MLIKKNQIKRKMIGLKKKKNSTSARAILVTDIR